METINKNFGRKISQARKRASLNQMQVAEACGISFRTYQRIEAGSISPRLDTAVSILETIEKKQVETELLIPLLQTSKVSNFYESEKKVIEKIKQAENIDFARLICTGEVQGVKRFFAGDFSKELSAIAYWEWYPQENKYFHSIEMEKFSDQLSSSFRKGLFHFDLIHEEDLGDVIKQIKNLLNGEADIISPTYRIKTGLSHFSVKTKTARVYDSKKNVAIIGIIERIL